MVGRIGGNRAKRESMFICVVPFKEPEVTMFQAGRYRDLCEKRDGVRKILHRDVVNVPRVSHWGAWRAEDPIYQDWIESLPTEYSR